MSSLHKYRDEIDSDTPLLGRLFWYGCSEDKRIEHSELVRALSTTSFGLFAPPKPEDSDTFRRACTQTQRKKVPHPTDKDIFTNYLLREVGRDDHYIWRRIVGERVNLNGKKLGYVQHYDVVFSKQTSRIEVRLVDTPDAAAEEMANEVISKFRSWQGKVNAQGIRVLFRRLTLSLSATSLRSHGAVYFVSEYYADRVAQLEHLGELLGDGVLAHSLPLVDNQKQRKMVKEAFEDEAVGELERLVFDISEARRDGAISSKKLAKFVDRFDTIKHKAKEYTRILDDALMGTNGKMDIARRVLTDMVSHVED